MVLQFDRQTLNITSPTVDGTKLTIQNLYNQIRTWQALHANMDEPNFMTAAGKQPLGLTNRVGITMAFKNNWMVGFEGVAGPSVHARSVAGGNLTAQHSPTGSVTTADVTGTTLNDTSGLFVRCSLQTGDVVTNVTDGSSTTITNVVSEIQITHSPLSGGTDNQWELGDVWVINSTHPVFPSSFIHITISQDAAPVEIDQDAIRFPDESHMIVSYDEASAQVKMGAWMERKGQVVTTATSCTITWYDPTGSQVFQLTSNSPDAQGHFRLLQSQTLGTDTDYYVIVSITDALGTIVTRRGAPTSQ